MAILLAAAHPNIELLGITTVSGNGSLDKVTYNAQRICAIAGIDVPVAQGANDPLAGKASAAPSIHGASALDGAELPEPHRELSPLPAVELIAELVRNSDRQVTLVPTGPMTNIAMFIQQYPDLLPKIDHISFMGGSVDRGNWTPYAEFNIWADPEAADVVLRSGLNITMTGLNISHTALATPQILDRISAINSHLATTVVDLLKFFANTYDEVFGMPNPPLHDPIAVAAVLDPTIMRTQYLPVSIELNGDLTRGATVVDVHGVTGREANVNVGLELDVERFWDLIIASVQRLS
jgi:purine nucleosidase/pyrimidine-specific ribonucleoside hydrolase